MLEITSDWAFRLQFHFGESFICVLVGRPPQAQPTVFSFHTSIYLIRASNESHAPRKLQDVY